MVKFRWCHNDIIPHETFACWLCKSRTGSETGIEGVQPRGSGEPPRPYIYFCPGCGAPNFKYERKWFHKPIDMGPNIQGLPKSVEEPYYEGRKSFSLGMYTSCALMLRKVLMNVAVDLGAAKNMKFIQYIDWLIDNGHILASYRDWVTVIKNVGNEATHEIPSISKEDAKNIVEFAEMLLKLKYDYPSRVNTTSP